jgi:uncharacterized damage-inducible protein DinB
MGVSAGRRAARRHSEACGEHGRDDEAHSPKYQPSTGGYVQGSFSCAVAAGRFMGQSAAGSAVQSPGMSDQPEVWLRGPVPEIPAALQPVAHALIQARDEVAAVAPTMPAAMLWRRAGAASPGFHLLHLAGALDRLFTYARGEALTDSQKAAARAEAQEHPDLDAAALVDGVSSAVARALDQLRATDPSALLDERRVGRTASSNTVGILAHAGEHSARHAGQFVTTVKMLGVL